MALDWSLKKVKNWQSVCYSDKNQQKMNVTTNTLIWAMLDIGIKTITEKNYKQVHSRIKYVYLLVGVSRYKDITLDDVENHIGLWTNAPTKTRLQFLADKAIAHEHFFHSL
jgi:hypothetical protein